MTEDEMKQTWCPDAMVISINMGAGNRPHPQGAHTPEFRAMCLCLGRQCSAWRWELTDAGKRMLDMEGLDVLVQKSAPNKLHGYCGRAGAP